MALLTESGRDRLQAGNSRCELGKGDRAVVILAPLLQQQPLNLFLLAYFLVCHGA